jgi:hypothetical protein
LIRRNTLLPILLHPIGEYAVQIDQDRRTEGSRERPCGGVFEIDMWRGRCT